MLYYISSRRGLRAQAFAPGGLSGAWGKLDPWGCSASRAVDTNLGCRKVER